MIYARWNHLERIFSSFVDNIVVFVVVAAHDMFDDGLASDTTNRQTDAVVSLKKKNHRKNDLKEKPSIEINLG